MAVALVPAALEAAITSDGEHQVDAHPSSHHGADQWRAVASQVLGEAALRVAVGAPADVTACPSPRKPAPSSRRGGRSLLWRCPA